MVKRNRPCIEYKIIHRRLQEKVQDAVNLIEEEKFEPFFSYYTKWTPGAILDLFLKTKNDGVKHWDLIPAEQYKNLLRRFMESPEMARIPDSVVDEWIMLIFNNLAKVISITKLYGRSKEFPLDDVVKRFPEYGADDVLSAMNCLHDNRFYDWARLDKPVGPAWSDTGIDGLYKIIKEYRYDMPPEEKLVLINRCLDVIHVRGRMAGFFLEGGVKTCDSISYE